MRRVLLALPVVVIWSVAVAQPSYQIQPLGDRPFIPTHLTEDGQVTGYLADSPTIAAYWQSNQLTLLTVSGSVGSRLLWANSTTLVGAADYTFPDQTRAISWENGQSYQLLVPSWPFYTGSQAVAASPNDLIIGTTWRIDYDFYGQLRQLGKGIIWRNGGYQLSPFYPQLDNNLVDVSVDNWTLGWVESRITGHIDSFLWRNETVIMLGLPGRYGYGTALNDAKTVVGYYDWGQTYGFVWSENQMSSLPLSAGAIACRPRDITNTYLIIGEMEYAGGLMKPFRFVDDQLIFLQDRLPPSSGWQLVTAASANNANQITGYGYYHGQLRGYLLTPVSEPSPILAILSSVLVVFLRHKRRLRH